MFNLHVLQIDKYMLILEKYVASLLHQELIKEFPKLILYISNKLRNIFVNSYLVHTLDPEIFHENYSPTRLRNILYKRYTSVNVNDAIRELLHLDVLLGTPIAVRVDEDAMNEDQYLTLIPRLWNSYAIDVISEYLVKIHKLPSELTLLVASYYTGNTCTIV
jgi:hypothetical protein